MIKEVTAFEINGKVFATIKEAEKYKFERLDEIELGDKVAIKDFFGGKSNKTGYVCCIENNIIYFTMNGSPPKEYLLSGKIKDGWRNIKIGNRTYSFDIGIHPRENLFRIKETNYQEI